MSIEEINKLHLLDFRKQLAFAYLACERLYPNYIYFSAQYGFGNPKKLRAALDYLHECLFSGEVNRTKAGCFIAEIDKNIPNPVEYGTVLASSALDACNAINETLDFGVDKQVNRLHDISIMATDTVDMYIQEADNLDPNTDQQFQQKIDAHPLMQNEMAMQKGIISYLLKTNTLQPSDITTLLQLQGEGRGNLDL